MAGAYGLNNLYVFALRKRAEMSSVLSMLYRMRPRVAVRVVAVWIVYSRVGK